MAKPLGSPKSGGRKKGTPNWKTQDLEETLHRLGVNVPEQIVALLPELPPEKRVSVLMDFMAFLYPKRKAIEQEIEVIAEKVELTPQERDQILIRQFEFFAKTEDEPEIAEAYQKLADHHKKLADAG